MQSWRELGFVWAVLAFGLVGGCGSDGGSGETADSGDAVVREDASPGREKDGGPEEDLDGGEDADVCVPMGCEDLGYECGEVDPDDNCGEPLDCGNECVDSEDDSTAYFTCGGGGKKYKCGCTPKTCEGELACGQFDDGCGGEVDCGDTCAASYDTCGGGAKANECGCPPNLNACGAAECGTADDGCGGEVTCGAHDGGCSDARTCSASKKCECKPQAELCAGKCGVQHIDGCPPVTCAGTCPTCEAGEACGNCTCPGAGAICANNQCCTPESQASACDGAVCGSKVNNCGQTVTCGSCASGQQCTEGKCVDPKIAALVGTYAAHTVGFAVALGQTSRSEALSRVTISTTPSGGLTMTEQSCWSAAYLLNLGETAENPTPISELKPERAANLFVTTTPIELAPNLAAVHQDLPGTKEWVRGKQSSTQNALGWRRGRPSYCTGGDPDPNGGPKPNDPFAIGPKKPWLKDTLCNCPEKEVKKRGLCPNLTGAALTTCVNDWAQNELPHNPKQASPASDVTDCRVVDDEKDGLPGVTAEVRSTFASADIQSASHIANIFWGKIDLSGAKKHTGVGQDQPELESANVACTPKGGLVPGALCDTSKAGICPGYADGKRINPIDFVPLEKIPAPTEDGWTCQAIYDRRKSLFGDEVFQPAYWFPDRYPDPDLCPMPR